MPFNRIPGVLALEDGTCFTGVSAGYEGLSAGEVVFNTSMTGYQEVISDNSYCGQIVAMTAPQIGNTGFNEEDHESASPKIQGLVMREISPRASNWRSSESLDNFLKRNKIVALSEIDTRSLTQHIRTKGAMRGIIASGDWNSKELVQKALESPKLEFLDLIGDLTTKHSYEWTEAGAWNGDWLESGIEPNSKKVVVFDFGVKQNILRALVSLGASVTVVPAFTTAEEVLAMKPDGVVLSNGPGNPARLGNVVEQIKKMFGQVPIFGICLGHQLLSLAFGATTYKMKFGHRGSNQPVLNHFTNEVEITSQNHSFCADAKTFPPDVIISHTNLNDGTVEGIRHRELPVFSVQYHPEAAAGPHDAAYLFREFILGSRAAGKTGKGRTVVQD